MKDKMYRLFQLNNNEKYRRIPRKGIRFLNCRELLENWVWISILTFM